jgi:hypothetical protein
MVPAELIYAVSITLTDEPTPMILRDAPADGPWADIDAATRQALTELAHLSIVSPDAREALISAAAFVRGDTPLSPAAAAAVSIARSRTRRATPGAQP